MDGDIERLADEYRELLREIYGVDIPVYTAAEVSVEDGLVRLDLFGKDGVGVKRMTLEEAMELARMIKTAMGREEQ